VGIIFHVLLFGHRPIDACHSYLSKQEKEITARNPEKVKAIIS
jgi:hypothetical protein